MELVGAEVHIPCSNWSFDGAQFDTDPFGVRPGDDHHKRSGFKAMAARPCAAAGSRSEAQKLAPKCPAFFFLNPISVRLGWDKVSP